MIGLILDGPTAMVLFVFTPGPVFAIAGIFLVAYDLHPQSQPSDTNVCSSWTSGGLPLRRAALWSVVGMSSLLRQ